MSPKTSEEIERLALVEHVSREKVRKLRRQQRRFKNTKGKPKSIRGRRSAGKSAGEER